MKRCHSFIFILATVFLCASLSADFNDDARDDLLFEDFEVDDGGFVGTLDWEWGELAWVGTTCGSSNYPPPAAYSGTKMWGTVLNDCYNNRGNNSGYDTCVNGNPVDDSILSFDVDLTGASDATLSFYEWFDLFLPWDWVEVRVNGTAVFQHCGGSLVEPTEWVLQTIDLTPYIGGVVTIEFHMMASTVVNHAGWYIDDVRVFTGSAMPTATPTVPLPTATPSIPLPTETPTPPPPTITPTPDDCLNSGDVNLDAEITAGDAQMAFLIALGVITPTYEEECAADCNGDDEVTAGDAQNIFLAVLGSSSCVDPLQSR